MAFAAGDRLGSFEIVGPLGAGGMGEVYRARDSKLNREVAIKVLPAGLAADADYLARFQREAQALAALQHPNIATIFGLEGNAIVMELVDGAPLRGPMSVAEALPIARQIAEALEAAHEKGIIHRDLKPGNILITPSGVVKILDFGLAKAVESTSNVSGANSPTLTMRSTEAGLILGTAGYMAPEQAAGKPVDRRADIWSFGVVLWELIAGKQLFDGETVSHTLAEVLKEPIDLSVIPAGPMRDLIGRCLDRNVKTRLQHIGEARIALENYKEAPPAAVVATGTNWGLVAVLVVVAAGGAWLVGSRGGAPAAQPLTNFHVDLGPEASLELTTTGPTFAMSPDGRRIAYVVKNAAGVPVLVTRSLDQDILTPLTGTENAATPFFSPDGQWIAYAADGRLRKVPVAGGSSFAVCDAAQFRGGAWLPDGSIAAALTSRSGLVLIPAAGGEPRPLTKVAGEEKTHRWPQALPDGSVLFISDVTPGNYENAQIEVVSVKSGQRKVLYKGGYFPQYLPSGHLLFMRRGALMAAPIDVGRLELTGPPVAVLADVEAGPGFGSANLYAGPSGTLLYRTGSASMDRRLAWVNADGKKELLPLAPTAFRAQQLSPDHKRVALTIRGEALAVYDMEPKLLRQLTPMPGADTSQIVWNRSSQYIFYRTDTGIFGIPADGSREPKRMTEGSNDNPKDLSPDGKQLYFARIGSYHTLPLDWADSLQPKPGQVAPIPNIEKQSVASDLKISPDGRWMAYLSDVSGRLEVYVRNRLATTGAKWQISTNGAVAVQWSPNGKELLYSDVGATVFAIPYTSTANAFEQGASRVWPTPGREMGMRAFSTDGKRLLVAFPTDDGKAQNHMVLLLHFADEVKRRVPGR